ncbi:hypothetical protein COU54_05290 [Candidatus Pacearchaeota archaeon CG10_big_fil_rev_8_21_14_0_10_31_24]|nr:MAG: hypothetical protein COU54_05290 [Candidatus Pacearchaeota archaeon CG10_big_fil_rev_8_21_14_0_10_31_24]
MQEQTFKRNIAFKQKIGDILEGKPLIENERLKFLEIQNKQVVRVNVIANIIDKYLQDGEKKFGSVTLDDGSGQIKVKTFGDDIEKFSELNQGDTVVLIGIIRTWNGEIYLTPDIIKKKEPEYLLLRKLETESESPKIIDRSKLNELKDKILTMIKETEKDGGIETERLILDLKESPDLINQEIKKLLEEGVAYEPRPGKIRYLG